MTILEATRTCLGKYFTFSGRATRPEFWKFLLFLLAVQILLTIFHGAIFGPTLDQSYRVAVNSAGQQSQGMITRQHYNGGVFGAVFALATVCPWLAVTWRRLHDSGRPGWLCLSPVVAFAVAGLLVYFFSTAVAINSATAPAGITLPTSLRVPQPWAGGLSALLIFCSLGFVLFWLVRKSQPGPNSYGPNPKEVQQ